MAAGRLRHFREERLEEPSECLGEGHRKVFPSGVHQQGGRKDILQRSTKEDIDKIIDIELKDLRSRAEEAGYKLVVTPSAKRFIADAGFDPAFGARPLKRAVMKYVEDPVSEFIISDRILQGRRKKGSSGLRTLRVGRRRTRRTPSSP